MRLDPRAIAGLAAAGLAGLAACAAEPSTPVVAPDPLPAIVKGGDGRTGGYEAVGGWWLCVGGWR